MESLGNLSEAEREAFEERAAIVEFLGGWPRPVAEAEARRAAGERRWLEDADRRGDASK